MLGMLINIGIFLIIINGLMLFLLPRMLFLPYKTIDRTPLDWNMKYDDVFLNTLKGHKLHGWYIPYHEAQQTLLFFHGNAGNISHREESIKIFHKLGLNVFIIDYRGYGKSSGKPSEINIYEDAHTAWQYLKKEKNVTRDKVIFFGRSMGCAVATKLAIDIQPSALILESPFSSINDMAKKLMPGLSSLVFLRFSFNNKEMIKHYHGPVLIMHSPDDEIIPFEQGNSVFQAANHNKIFFQLSGDHNSGFIQSQPEYAHRLSKFLLSVKDKSELKKFEEL